MSLSIIVHGGAAEIPEEERDAKRAGCQAAARAGWAVLQRGGSAIEAVEAAIRLMEDDPTFNAGFGSMLNADGMVRMDAGLMEGRELRAGAIGAVEGIRNPISVAGKLMDEPTVLMVGPYVREFARERGLAICSPEAMISPKQRHKWEEQHGGARSAPLDKNTVGAVALDSRGNLACGVSTGGTGNNPPGRVGDSACVGGGFYADNAAGAAVMTGDGENILRLGLAKSAVERLRSGCTPYCAAGECIEQLERRVQGEAGCILMNGEGRIGWYHNSSNMACAYMTSGMGEPVVYLHIKEERQEASLANV